MQFTKCIQPHVLWKHKVYTDESYYPNEDTVGLQLASKCDSFKKFTFSV